MKLTNNQFPSIEQMSGKMNQAAGQHQVKPSTGSLFHEILREKQVAAGFGELKFTKHANERLASRNIDLTDDQFKRLETGAKKAGEKGIRESLVLVDDLAFIVNVRNQTVITAVKDAADKIFTNIDGAVIV